MLPDFGPPEMGTTADMALDEGVDAEEMGIDQGPETGRGCQGPPGLYVDGECTVLAEGVMPYEPEYWLWTDSAGKERHVRLPEGTVIDTTDLDEWRYPVGTTFYKTFTVDGQRIETRLYRKEREGEGITAWAWRTYAWNEAGTGATEVFAGVEDALGTDHDIPSVGACVDCHNGGGSVDQVLGFGTIQLDHERAGSLNLRTLNADGWLSPPVLPGQGGIPGSALEAETLGYLHANCGMCHGGSAPQAGMSLRLDAALARAADSQAYATAVGQASSYFAPEDPDAGLPVASIRVVPGAPLESTLFRRMRVRDEARVIQMPPLGTEFVDPEGIDLVERWILALPPAE
ncbi:MAG: hypothetical protein AAF447_17700 [Myxococcota bacterium]